MGFKFDGYPLNPYPWVDQNWGYNFIVGSDKSSDWIYPINFSLLVNFESYKMEQRSRLHSVWCKNWVRNGLPLDPTYLWVD